MNIQKQPQEVFYKKNALKNFPVIFTKILRTNLLNDDAENIYLNECF